MAEEQAERDVRRSLEGYMDAWKRRDLKRKATYYHEDAVQEWPQSGERVRGLANIGAIDQNYPGLPDPSVRRIIGQGGLWVLELVLDYSGTTIHGCSILEMRNGKIERETGYFAEPFEPPKWRAEWVEGVGE